MKPGKESVLSFDPQAYLTDLCEKIDAGFFSSDMLEVVNLDELEDYIGRWTRALAERRTRCEVCSGHGYVLDMRENCDNCSGTGRNPAPPAAS